MRTSTAGELTTLAKLEREVTVRVRVANGSGTMIDYSRWVDSYSIDHDVDQPVSGATVAFRRDSGTTQSLSPLRTDSTLNVNDVGAYSPILDLNRALTIEVATTAIGAAIQAGDYKMMFEGTIDIVNWEDSPVVVTCRDGMAPLVDAWIEAEAFFGTTPVGTAIQDVMDDVSDSVFGAGVEPVYTPVDPAYLIVQYRQQKMSVMDSWIDLMQLRGLDIREKWHDGTSAFRHTLLEPPRTKTVPDHTFTPNKYITVSQLNLELTNIRNAVQVSYKNSADLGNRAVVTRTDGPSITKYKRRFFLIQEGDSSPIDTSAEATLMADAALADLKDPKAEQEVEMPFFWPAELGDLYRYTDNKVHYNTDQDWAVVEIKHVFALKRHRTIIKVRGSPIGQYNTWLGRGGTIGGGGAGGVAKAPYPFISPLNTESDELDWDLRFNAVAGSGGGGTNLTYTIKSKKTFASEVTLDSGNASAFPRTLTVTRHPRQAAVLTFRVEDAATAMFAEATWSIPAYTPGSNDTGNALRSYPYSDGSYAVKAEDTAGQTISTGGKGKSDFAVKNSGGTTSFGTNRHNDEQSGKDAGSTKSFGVTFDNIPQMRALPQNIMTYRQASAAADQNIDVRATNVTVSTYDTRAKIVTGGTSTPQTDDFAATLNGTPVAAGVLIENDGAAAYCNLADANAVLTTYTAFFDVDTTDMDELNTLYVDLYKNDGVSSTSWTLVGSKSYGPGQAFSDIMQFNAALADDWDTRIVVSYETTPQSLEKAHVTCQEMIYNVITGGSEFDATALGSAAVIFQAMEAP